MRTRGSGCPPAMDWPFCDRPQLMAVDHHRLTAALTFDELVSHPNRFRNRTPEQPEQSPTETTRPGCVTPVWPLRRPHQAPSRSPDTNFGWWPINRPANRLALPADSAAEHLNILTINSSVTVAKTLIYFSAARALSGLRTMRTFGRRFSLRCPARRRFRIESLAAETAVPGNAAQMDHQRVDQAAVLRGHNVLAKTSGTAQFFGLQGGLTDGFQIVILAPP